MNLLSTVLIPMETETLFSTVANDVLIPLFSEWLEIYNLAIIDTASCSKNIRNTFLSILQHPGFIHHTDYKSCAEEYLSWLVLRQLRVDCLDFGDGMVVAGRLKEFVEYFESLKYLNYFKMNGYAYSCFLSNCNAIEFKINSLDLSEVKSIITDEYFVPILINPVHCNLTELNLSHCPKLTDQICSALSTNCPKLTVLTFVGCEGISVEGIIIVVKSFSTQLTNLTVIPTRSQSESYTDDKLMAIITHCPSLTYLDISFWTALALTEDNHKVKLSKITQLKHLSVSGCKNLTGCALSTFFQANKNLTSLSLDDLPQIYDMLLIILAGYLQRLEILDLSGCTNITDQGFIYIALHCPLLKEVYLSGCRKLTDVSVLLLIEHCPLLTIFRGFERYGISDYSISEMIDRCRNLTQLYASESALTVGNAMRALKGSNKLVLNGGQSYVCRHLHIKKRNDTFKEVIFCSSEPQSFVSQWKTVALLCPDLHTVELHNFDNITAGDMVTLITPSVTSFTLNTFKNRDFDHLLHLFEHLVKNNTELKKLRIVNCGSVCLTALVYWINTSGIKDTPTLTHLQLTNVSVCTQVTIKSLLSIYKHLKVLELSGNHIQFDFDTCDSGWLREYIEQGIRVTIVKTYKNVQGESNCYESGNDDESVDGGEEDEEGDNDEIED